MKKNTTKRALLMSVLALLLCVSILIGSTFAWFTDSVTSTGNKIVAGTLDISLFKVENDLEGFLAGISPSPVKETEITDSSEPLFSADTRWEPGYESAVSLMLVNNGSLALKWQAVLRTTETVSKLADVIDVYILDGKMINTDMPRGYYDEELRKVGTLAEVLAGSAVVEGTMTKQGETNYFGILLKMQESAGNEYQGLTACAFDVTILATQYTYESDSFDNAYDAEATYPVVVSATLPENRTAPTPINAGPVTIEIPTDAPAGDYQLTVDNTSVIVDEDGNSVANFDINLTRDGQSVNTDGTEYTITIFVAKGLNPDTTKLYHKGEDITSSIISASPVDGTVTFKTDSFSPFAVEYKVDCNLFVEQDPQTKVKTMYVFTAEGFEQVNKMMADKTAGQNAVVKLCANIDMTGKTWTPVDSHADTAFYLTEFDGQGFTISNLTIKGQAMFTRFAGFGDVTVKDVTFYNAKVESTSLNTSILTVQTYQNLLLDNVDVKNSSITGTYKVAPLVGTVYDEKATSIVCTVRNCDVSDTVVTSTVYDFFTCGMISFVYTTNNDFVEYENCSVTNVQLRSVGGGYDYHANIHYTSADTDDQINEHPGVTVTNVTFEKIS